jgi:two-component system, OmpR family, sensor histidine kinase KdpD
MVPGRDGGRRGEARASVGGGAAGRAAAYGWAVLISAAATGVCEAMASRFNLADLIMIYLAGVVAIASRLGRGPASLASILSVGLFDFFFVPPRFTLEVADVSHAWTFAVMLAVGLVISALSERARRQAEEARAASLEAERERLRNSLLSSVSHDLRTPLAVITGATTTLLEDDARHDASTRRELTQTVYEEAQHLSRLVRNLLDMTRLEAGVEVKKEWQPLDEVIGASLTRHEQGLRGRAVRVSVPADLPLVPIDGVVLEQVLTNLLENALKYTPAGCPIEVSAARRGGEVRVCVADEGPGFPGGDEARLFEKFYRSPTSGGAAGVGLGLAIARAVVVAHGGRIWAERRPGGGAAFWFTIPLDGDPPRFDAERPPLGERGSGGAQ